MHNAECGMRNVEQMMGRPSLVTRHSSLPMRTGPRSGSVLMEAVLCLPLLLFLVTGIVQFARIWEARLFVRHAAYNAARAALVYNTDDYATNVNGRVRFYSDRGAVWLAAVNTLVWKSATFSAFGEDDDYLFPGFTGDRGFALTDYRVPNSAFIQDQVHILSDSFESNGVVRVTVSFKYPLLFSVFALGGEVNEAYGDEDDKVALVHDTDLDAIRETWDDNTPHINLRETRVLPKPWSTAHYPRVSKDEADFMDMEMQQ